MNRRNFLAMTPAFPVAAISASLVLREKDKPPVELDLSVLKLQPGDKVVLSVPLSISRDTADRIRSMWEQAIPGTTALILADGMKVDGVLRGSE